METVVEWTTNRAVSQNWVRTYNQPGRVPGSDSGSGPLGFALAKTFWSKKTSVTTPNFRAHQHNGTLKVNPFSWHRISTTYGASSWQTVTRHVDFVDTTSVYGDFNWADAGRPLVPSVEVFDGNPLVQLEMNKKVKDQHFDVAVLVAERQASLATILDAVRRASSAIDALRKGNPGLFIRALNGDFTSPPRKPKPPYVARPRRNKKGVPFTSYGIYWKRYRADIKVFNQEMQLYNNFLSWKYGVKPILQDAEGAAKELAKTLHRRITHRVSAQKTFSANASIAATYNGVSQYAQSDTQRSVKHSCNVVITASIGAFLSEVGLTNPAIVAWEKIPLSFVVDWFIPIGDIAGNLDVFLGRDILDYCVGLKTETTRRNTWAIDRRSSTSDYLGQASTVTVETFVSRQIGSPGVVLWAPTPPVDWNMDRIFTALALLRQRTSK